MKLGLDIYQVIWCMYQQKSFDWGVNHVLTLRILHISPVSISWFSHCYRSKLRVHWKWMFHCWAKLSKVNPYDSSYSLGQCWQWLFTSTCLPQFSLHLPPTYPLIASYVSLFHMLYYLQCIVFNYYGDCWPLTSPSWLIFCFTFTLYLL